MSSVHLGGAGTGGARKIRVPPPRGLCRERLERQLATFGSGGAVVIVCAPAGSGKSTFLAHHAASRSGPVAWYQAEGGDQSSADLLTNVGRAVARSGGTGTFDSMDDAIAALASWAAAGACLVVDDVHTLAATDAERALASLIDRTPAGLELIVASRHPPRFDVASLRQSGRLIELGPDDLRFRTWEVEELFRDVYGEPLPPEDLAALARRTGGWAAGLQLFHLATQGKPAAERRSTIARLGARAGLAREYLARHVLAGLPEDELAFLLHTCLLGPLVPSMCDELTGTESATAMLDELVERQLFTVRFDDASYRYHEAFRSHLEAELVARRGEAAVRELARQSGALLEKGGLAADALRAFARGEDWTSVDRLLRARGVMVADGVGPWIELLPVDLARSDPWLLLATARREVRAGRLTTAAATYGLALQAATSESCADICHRERLLVTTWTDADHPPVAQVHDTPHSFIARLRSATQRDPGVSAADATGGVPPIERLAGAVGALLSGRARTGRRVLLDVATDERSGDEVALAARVLALIGALLAGESLDTDEVSALAEAGDAADLPVVAAIVGAMRRTGGVVEQDEPWLVGVVRLVEGLAAGSAGVDASAELEEARTSFDRVGARVLAAWASALIAGMSAHESSPAAGVLARRAAEDARAVGASGALAVAMAALAAVEPDQPAHRDAARAEDPAGDLAFVDRLLTLAHERAAPRGKPPVAPTNCIAREREVDAVRGILDELTRGRGTLLTIAGPAGIGKTRLAEELRTLAVETGVAVAWGHAAEGAPPYWPWTQALEGLAERIAPSALASDLGADGEYVRHLAPGITGRAGDAPPVDELPRPVVLADALARFLRRVTRRTPCALVLDDLHVADSASLALLATAAPQLAAAGVLIAAIYRENGRGTAVDSALAATPGAVRLRLSGLDREGVRTLAERVAGTPLDADLCDALSRRTGGNPHFVREWVRESTEADAIPHSVRSLLLTQLDDLSAACRQTLDLAAVIGSEVERDLLLRASGLTPASLDAYRDEAYAAGVFMPHASSGAREIFAEPLMRDAIYDELAPSRRAELHCCVGDVLAASREATPALTAYHLLRAGADDRIVQAGECALQATEIALMSGAWHDAIDQCVRALAVVEAAPEHLPMRARLRLALGEAQRRSGELRACRATFRAAVEEARVSGDAMLFARAVLGRGELGEDGGPDEGYQRLLREAQHGLPAGDSPMRARLMARSAESLLFEPGASTRRLEVARAADAMAFRTGDKRAQADAAGAVYYGLLGPTGLGERLQVAERMQRLGEELGELEITAMAHRLTLWAQLEAGDADGVRREVFAMRVVAEKLGEPEKAWDAAIAVAAQALLDGDLADAERLIGAAREAGAEEPLALHAFSAQWIQLRREIGGLGELAPLAADAADQHPAIPAYRAVLVTCLVAAGRVDEARFELSRIAGDGFARLADDHQFAPAAVVLADGLVDLDEPEAARVLYAALEPWAGQVATTALGMVCAGPVDLGLAACALAAGDFARAAAHADQAHALAVRMKAPTFGVRALVAGARARIAANADIARAESMLDEAARSAERLGMTEIARDASARLSLCRDGRAGARDRDQHASRLAVRCLGAFEVWVDGRTIDLAAVKPKARTLFRLLATHAGQPVARSVLLQALWPDLGEDAGSRSLHVAVSALRKLLEPDAPRGGSSLIVRDRESYCLVVDDPTCVDVTAVRSQLVAARAAVQHGHGDEAAGRLTTALASYGGDLLPEEGPLEWVVQERELLRREIVNAAGDLARLELQRDDPAAAVAAAERGLAIDACDDGLWRTLIGAHRRAGDAAAAAWAEKRYRAVLDDLGVSPS